MIKETGIAPRTDFKRAWKNFMWYSFHYTLERRDKEALDKVISSVETTIKAVTDIEKNFWIFETGHIREIDIGRHLLHYLKEIESEELKQSCRDIRNRYQWNQVHNILRYLKRVRNDEAPYLLPREDRELAQGFIKRLEHPPREKFP